MQECCMNEIKKTDVWVLTISYFQAHRKEPRGKGTWAFGTTRTADSDQCVFFEGMYSKAKAQARAHFAALGIDRIFLQS